MKTTVVRLQPGKPWRVGEAVLEVIEVGERSVKVRISRPVAWACCVERDSHLTERGATDVGANG